MVTSLAYYMLAIITGFYALCCFMPWCLHHHWLILCCVITPSLAALCHGVLYGCFMPWCLLFYASLVSTSLAYFMLCDNPISGCFMPWCLHHWLIICCWIILCCPISADNPISGFMPWCLHHWLILCCVITPSLAALCHGVYITGLFYAV